MLHLKSLILCNSREFTTLGIEEKTYLRSVMVSSKLKKKKRSLSSSHSKNTGSLVMKKMRSVTTFFFLGCYPEIQGKQRRQEGESERQRLRNETPGRWAFLRDIRPNCSGLGRNFSHFYLTSGFSSGLSSAAGKGLAPHGSEHLGVGNKSLPDGSDLASLRSTC